MICQDFNYIRNGLFNLDIGVSLEEKKLFKKDVVVDEQENTTIKNQETTKIMKKL